MITKVAHIVLHPTSEIASSFDLLHLSFLAYVRLFLSYDRFIPLLFDNKLPRYPTADSPPACLHITLKPHLYLLCLPFGKEALFWSYTGVEQVRLS